MIIKPISSKETLSLRQLVLRPGKSVDECVFEGDNEPENFHLGAFEGKVLAGIVSLMNRKNTAFTEKKQFQLRGMAVLPEFRNRKIAVELLKAAEEELHAQKAEIIWCNARKIAIGFYEKNGFERIGGLFEIPQIGPHCLMVKKLGNFRFL